MGIIVRFPQEQCRWPEPGDHRFAPAEIIILPMVRVERQTQDLCRGSIQRLRDVLKGLPHD